MPDDVDTVGVADALFASVGLLVRRLRQLPADGEVTMPERSALSRLDRDGPATSAELARAAQISPQSMGTTLAALTERGLVQRHRDPADGRRVVLSITRDGMKLLGSKRSTRSRQLAAALAREFTPADLKRLMAAAPLIERLAHSI
jgi:DNA-binding MarR family transcriptional regulator